jgi:polygalacturonase
LYITPKKRENMPSKLLKRVGAAAAVTLALTMFPALTTPAGADDDPPGDAVLRPMEYLTRGLVAAQTSDGIFLSWRYLGNEPDGISWNVYRQDGEAGWAKIATIAPRDVQPESDYETNPGVVKEDSTPSNYTDPDGTLASIYEVAPVIDGVEGVRQGMSVPMLNSIGSGTQANRGAVTYIQLKAAPDRVPLARFTYRGRTVGAGTNLYTNFYIPGTTENWYTVDMDLLKEFRQAFENQDDVTQEQLADWVSRLNALNTTPNYLGDAVYQAPVPPLTNGLTDGKISQALYDELEGEFIKYVENLDSGTSLPYALTETGAVVTATSAAYVTQDMTVGDFDGDGEYEIVVKWRGTHVDPMYSEPIYSGANLTTAPEYIDVYKLDGTLMFRVDMGYNVRAANDHETTMFVEDFDGDGKSELMLKTALGTRIGNWDEAAGTVVYPDTLATVVGGEDGLAATTPKFIEYFNTGNTAALDTYWSLLNSFTISYRSPVATGGNDGVNDPSIKRWIKTYHVGPIGPAKDGQEFFSAFEWDAAAGQGILVDSEQYPFVYEGSVDGENWAMTPCTQRGNYSYLAFPGPGTGGSSADYKAQMMDPNEAYWLTNPWKAAVWGDAQGNRANRYLGVVAALDGEQYYAVSQRGYYHRTTLAAFYIVDGQVTLKAAFDSADPQYWSLGGSAYDYQNRGNHYTDAADLDGDGRDEIVLKAMSLELSADGTKILPEVINGDIMPTIAGMDGAVPTVGVFQFATDAVRNNPLNVWAPLRHGDRSALLPVDNTNKLMLFSGSEEHLLDDLRTGIHSGWIPGPEAHDPTVGKTLNDEGEIVYGNSLLYGVYQASDDEGSVAGNFSNRWPGAQAGSAASTTEVRSLVTGEVLTTTSTGRGLAQGNYAIWFGGGLTAMVANGATISSINDLSFATSTYLATGLTSTGNKSTSTLKADLLGDWREELVLRGSNNRLAIVTTLAPTEYGIRTLMHDPMYRNGVANKNTGYDQFGFASFYLGDEAELPAMRTDIYVPEIEIPYVPQDPTNLEVPPLAYDEDSIILTWEKPADATDARSPEIVDYEVFQDGVSLGSTKANFAEHYAYLNAWYEQFYDQTADYDHYQVNLTSFYVTGLAAETEYTFTVRAVYADGGTSGLSEPVTATTAPTPTVIDAADYGATYITSKTGDNANYATKNGGTTTEAQAATAAAIEANTAAIQAAIDATPAGGKVVLKGSGDNAAPWYYPSGSIFLHSNMTFEIEAGAVLLGSPIFDHYPRSLLVYPYSQDIRTYGLINAVTWDLGTLENIRIVGEGAVDGNGWKNATSALQTVGALDPTADSAGIADPTGNNWRLPSYYAGSSSSVSANGILAGDAYDKSRADATPNSASSQWYNTRPNLLVVRGVKGLLYEGLTFYNPAFHGIVNYQSEDITSVGTQLMTYNANNGDGIEFGDSLNLHIFNNFYDTGDDAINFAAGQGTSVRNETDEVASGQGRIFNNYVRNGHGGLIAAGSHTGGWIGELTAEDNLYNTNESGQAGVVRIKAGATTSGGVRDIIFRDNALHYSVAGSSIVNVETSYSDGNASTAFGPESEVPTVYENVYVSNITVTGVQTGALINVPSPGNSYLSPKMQIREFHFDNIRLLQVGNNGGRLLLNGVSDSSFTNISNARTVTSTISNYYNLTVQNVTNVADITPVDVAWPSGASLGTAVDGTKVTLTWPTVENASAYWALVQDDHSREYVLHGELGAEATSYELYLEPGATYTVAIQPIGAATRGEPLAATVTTGTADAHTPDTVTVSTPTVTLPNPSGISWQTLQWTNATTSNAPGVHYYEIAAVPQTSPDAAPLATKVYRAYYDIYDYGRTDRRGYALWGLDDGVTYSATVTAVSWTGERASYTPVEFTTVPDTQQGVPEWAENAALTVDGDPGTAVTLTWSSDDVTSVANGDTAVFAGYRVVVDGVAVQPAAGGLDQVNATPTTTATSYVLDTTGLAPGAHTVSVEAGYKILKYASGGGGLSGSTVFTGTANTDLARNQITFGKWTGHGPSAVIIVPEPAPPLTLSSLTIGGVPTGGNSIWAVFDSSEFPLGTAVSYQWYRDGAPITGAKSATYVVKAADIDHALTVELTAVKNHYQTLVTQATPVTPTELGVMSVGSLTIGGVTSPGNNVWAVVTDPSIPAGATLGYQWKLDGVDIPGATSGTYRVQDADADKALTVTLSATKANCQPFSITSEAKTVTSQGVMSVGSFTIGGVAAPGNNVWVVIKDAVIPTGATLAYQWARDGVNIPGATSSTYRVTDADVDTELTVTLTATKANCTTFTVTAAAHPAAEGIMSVGAFGVDGTGKIGFNVWVVITDPTIPGGATLSYQWYRDGNPIDGATAGTYRLAAADDGHVITVTLTAVKAGCQTLTVTSAGFIAG